VRENKWRAARYGVEAEIIVDATGRTTPLRDALDELVDDLMPIAERLGCTAELSRIKHILDIGPSYARQRAVAAAHGGDLTAVVDSLMAEMQSNAPIPAVAAR
jgi:carboxylate-amine ligase